MRDGVLQPCDARTGIAAEGIFMAPGPEQAAWSIRRTLADVLDEVVAT